MQCLGICKFCRESVMLRVDRRRGQYYWYHELNHKIDCEVQEKRHGVMCKEMKWAEPVDEGVLLVSGERKGLR